ncbi:alpha-L-fucosidase [Sediminibacterium sp. WSJ-3]|nr:alpha-L-fucosidase [Sediminibacterium soli]
MKNGSQKLGWLLICAVSILCSTRVYAQVNGDEDKEMFNRGKARDRQETDKAVKGWWTASMKNRDRRIAWWREAKFGMFIHWGIYSGPGGEWKGKKVSGYAEHLMRKEKISRAEYLDLAHIFSPVKFNADEWAAHAKRAGMKYLVITAKHHDGFAMYDSKLSDFTIIKQTPFKRDPMKELREACKKQGIRFGFYYSHAFDWEHPQAPGNDWEYKNPGGDLNLHGGRDWYDLHPDLLEKAKKYVDEKAIPQIRELLNNYHPDILWFDTPHKLPLSENIRILQAIRETDGNVVVNGRLVRSAEANFGDYKNTADRPAEFFPVTGDWEAIPTTNESYGYHTYDNSHKPVAHFIQLLASAASRGGNLLMNIGPKGDGAFDTKDLAILDGIGDWMQRNGESIYGTVASPLPLQNWGVSTMKGNKLYLHVFHFPADGKLHVGGLRSGIVSARYVTAPQQKIGFSRVSPTDYVLQVGARAIDTVNTVIVLEIKEKILTDSIRYLSPNISQTRLLAFDATQTGNGFSFGDGKTDRYYVENWKSKDQSLSWTFRTTAEASFRIHMKYIAAENDGGAFLLTSDSGFRKEGTVMGDKKAGVTTNDLGIIRLKPGIHTLTLAAVSISKTELMKILEIDLDKSPD